MSESDFPPLSASATADAGGAAHFFPQATRKRPLSSGAQAAALNRPVPITDPVSSLRSAYPAPIDPKKVRVSSVAGAEAGLNLSHLEGNNFSSLIFMSISIIFRSK